MFLPYAKIIARKAVPSKDNKNPVKGPANEVHLRQLTVDEAILKLEQYLNDAFMAGLSQVSIVHGKGTGTLRQVVQGRLANHPLVKSYRLGEYGEGGDGVTVAYLFPR